MVSGNRKINQHLFWSIAQVKRCAEVVPDSFIMSSLHKHRAAMIKAAEPCEMEILDSFRAKFDNILDRLTFTNVDTVNEYSTSACWEAPGVEGGAKAELQYLHVRNGHTSNDELLKMDYHPRKGVMERRGFVTSTFSDLLEDAPSVSSRCTAKVYPVCEPLKIRNVTKSNCYQYALAKGLQLDIHGYLKRFFQFSLIGEPISRSNDFGHIERLVQRSPYGGFASGDFSAATDNVKIQLTKLCFERILLRYQMMSRGNQNITTKFLDTLRNVIYEHEIHYPTGYGEDLEPALQQNGQLMGSVLSFPILCMINLCAYWHSVQPEVDDFTDLNVLVNGDDILFRTSPEKYKGWLDFIPTTGLFPSPGKNFYHDKYCTINSQLFNVNDNTVEYIPFYNVGMLLGQSKGMRSSEKQKPVHCLYSETIEGSLNPLRADTRFKYYNNDKLSKTALSADGHVMNYYISRELGGLGMKMPGMTYISAERYIQLTGEELNCLAPYTIVTGVQRKIANYLYNKWTQPYVKPPMKPIGVEIDLDAEDNNFIDIKDMDFKILVPDKCCPMPPWCRELASSHHDPNWSCPPTDSMEQERLKFVAKGVRVYRTAKMPIPCNKVCASFTEYKYVGDRWWKEVLPEIQLEDELKALEKEIFTESCLELLELEQREQAKELASLW